MTLFIVLCAVIVILNLLDALTTSFALEHGLYEGNPILKYMIRKKLFIPFKIFMICVMMTLILYSKSLVAACIISTIYLGIVVWNIITIRRSAIL